MLVHLNDDKRAAMTNTSSGDDGKSQKKNGLLIPVFDIHHKIVGNGNGSNRISTTIFDIRYNPKKTLLFSKPKWQDALKITPKNSHSYLMDFCK